MWKVQILDKAVINLAAATVNPGMALAAAGAALLVAAAVFLVRNYKKPEEKKEREPRWKKEDSRKQI